jgi:hypothetical protein
MKKPLVDNLSNYRWSSYINRNQSPARLKRDLIYDLGTRQRYAAYRRYVESGVNKNIETFYGKVNQPSILGSDNFIKHIIDQYKDKKPFFDKAQGNYLTHMSRLPVNRQ